MTTRPAAVVLALSAAYVGAWAQVAPRSFYDDFPFPGRHWVSADGVYVEHLTRDVGGLYLALLVVTAWAVVRPDLARPIGCAWLVFSVPHLVFHLEHLGELGTWDRVGNVVTLGGTCVLALLLVLRPARPGAGRSPSPGPPPRPT